MRVLPAALRALPLTFLVYVVEAAFAVIVAAPLGLELLSDDRASLRDAAGGAVWLDRLSELAPALNVSRNATLLTGLALLLLTPWMRLAWLQALARPSGLQHAFEHGTRLYLRALWVSLLSLALLALCLLPWGALMWLSEKVFSEAADARGHDLLLAALLVPCILCTWFMHVVHDLAYARALTQTGWRALRTSLRPASRPRVQAYALTFAVAALALRWAHVLVFRKSVAVNAWSATVLLQATCLAALFVRSLWLAWALTCAEEQATSRGRE